MPPPAIANGSGNHHGDANPDRGVPTFDNEIKSYREYRMRAQLYAMRLKLDNKESHAAISLLSGLSGQAWLCVEPLLNDMSSLESPTAWKTLLEKLDTRFKYDVRTEMPDAFEEFFYKHNRRHKETLFEYINRSRQLESRLREHEIKLPSSVHGWMLLRTGGYDRRERNLILGQLGRDISFDRVAEALQLTFGQESTLAEVRASRTYWGEDGAYDESYTAEGYEPEYDDAQYYGTDHYPPDEDAEYYHNEPEESFAAEHAPFDTGEFDEVYSNYVDARRRMQDLRLARGFYPVVAVAGPMPTAAGSNPAPSGKGKAGKSPPKGQGKKRPASASGPPPGRPAGKTPAARGSAAVGKQTCLRCGQVGHWARNCPQATSSASSAKRPRPEDDDAMAMMAEECFHTGDTSDSTPSHAILDGGAVSFLVGNIVYERYLRQLNEAGYTKPVRTLQCNKNFRFGSDKTETSRSCAILPVAFGGRSGHIVVYIIDGATPFLFPRPLMEDLKLSICFGSKTMRWHDGDWFPVTVGRQGHYILDMLESYAPENKFEDFYYYPGDAEKHIEDLPLQNEELGESRSETINNEDCYNESEDLSSTDPKATDGDSILEESTMRGMIYSLTHAAAGLRREVSRSRTMRSRRKVVWEVYTQEGPVANAAAAMGADARAFGLHNGWDLTKPDIQAKFLALMDQVEPDEIHLSPVCGPWSIIQELNILTPARATQLRLVREWHHRYMLNFAAEIFEKQRLAGRHAHLEHPLGARSWQTKAFARMHPVTVVDFDQCEYGLCVDESGDPSRKPTRVVSTKRCMSRLRRKCSGEHRHVPLVSGLAAKAEHYPPALANALAQGMMSDDFDDPDDNYSAFDIYPIDADGDWEMPIAGTQPAAPPPAAPGGQADEEMPVADPAPLPPPLPEAAAGEEEDRALNLHRDLRDQYGGNVLNYVAKLHKGLGHPHPAVLSRMLKDADATEVVLGCAKHYRCAACLAQVKPDTAADSGPIPARNFGDLVMMDVLKVKYGPRPRDVGNVLSIVDVATRYMVTRVLEEETAEHTTSALERAWMRHFPPMKVLRFDEAKYFNAEAVKEWCDKRNILVDPAPGEAHTRLGVVERRHQVLRAGLEHYIEDRALEPRIDSLKEAVCYVPQQINTLSFSRGYSPAQWVLGQHPDLRTDLTSDFFNFAVQHEIAEGDSEFAAMIERRTAAKVAFVRADTDARLRRALHRRQRRLLDPCAVGQRCYYWREQGTSRLQKSRWRGPGTVVMRQDNAQGRPSVYWIVHGTSLVRAAPEHVRPDVDSMSLDGKCTTIDNIEAASAALEQIRRRATTSYLDLRGQQSPVDLDDEDSDDDEEQAVGGSRTAPMPTATPAPTAPEIVPADDRAAHPVPPAQVDSEHSEDGFDTSTTPEPELEASLGRGVSEWSSGRTDSEQATEEGATAAVHRPEDRPIPPDESDENTRTTTTTFGAIRSRAAAERRQASNPYPSDIRLVNDEPLPEHWSYDNDIFVLNERHMTPDERAAFRNDKCRELMDFFNNQVWCFDTAQNARPERTLRARFVLKWSKNPDGSPRAKARLILQGFNDPDALSGELNTSAPTATRLARQCALAVAALKGWLPWVADVATAFLQSQPQSRVLHVLLPKDALDLLGASYDTRMKLLKPMYGQTDAPRAWYLEARSRMLRLGFTPHPLDPCLFMSFRTSDGTPPVLDGLVCLHVDDMLGSGDPHLHHEQCYAYREQELKKAFNFRTWKQIDANTRSLEYCGANINALDDGTLIVNYSDYARKIKPITVNADIKDVTQPATAAEVRQLRGLLGSLQWPASQGCPHLSCSVSMLQGEFGTATRRTLLEANKALRFFKTNSDVGLLFRKFDDGYTHDLTDVGFVATTDAAWATRPDGTSQGGYLIMLVPKECFDGKPTPFMCLDWRSMKLRRVSRSSLNSEAQSAASAVDALEQVKVFWSLMQDPHLDPRADATMIAAGPSALLTDAKALYDASQKEHVGNFEDRRTGIEVMVIKERMAASGSQWKWCSSERQYADGMTKTAARQLLAERLRASVLHLIYDETFTASKKKTLQQRQASVRSTVSAAKTALVLSSLLPAAMADDPVSLIPSDYSRYTSLNQIEFYYQDCVYNDHGTILIYPHCISYFIVFALISYTVLFAMLYCWKQGDSCCQRIAGMTRIAVYGNDAHSLARITENDRSTRTTYVRDVGVMGPVHHNGRRYWADTQGFREGMSVDVGPVYTLHSD
jgi:hypothetical protein